MTTTFYRHWRDAPERVWRWPNFSPAETACRGTGKLLVNEPALDRLQALRDRLGKPLIVRSAYRSPKHNRAVGGAKRSKHLEGTAFDIAMAEPRSGGLRGGGAGGRVPRVRLLPALGLHPRRSRAGHPPSMARASSERLPGRNQDRAPPDRRGSGRE